MVAGILGIAGQEGRVIPAMEDVLMATVLNCVSSGWLVLAAGLLIDGVLIFAGIKLFRRLSLVKHG